MPKGRARILLDASFRFVLPLSSLSLSLTHTLASSWLLLLVKYEPQNCLATLFVMLRKFRGIAKMERNSTRSSFRVRKGKRVIRLTVISFVDQLWSRDESRLISSEIPILINWIDLMFRSKTIEEGERKIGQYVVHEFHVQNSSNIWFGSVSNNIA